MGYRRIFRSVAIRFPNKSFYIISHRVYVAQYSACANLCVNKPNSKNSDPALFTTPGTKIRFLGIIFKDALEGLSSRTADAS